MKVKIKGNGLKVYNVLAVKSHNVYLLENDLGGLLSVDASRLIEVKDDGTEAEVPIR